MFVEKAEAFATACHRRQYRRDGVTPYITHPQAVVTLLKSAGVIDQDILAAGWLHDAIEDCGVSKEEITKRFNGHVASIVGLLTRDVGREEYNKRILSAEYGVQMIKLADTVHNCSTLYAALPSKTIARKVKDVETFYLDLAKKICPPFYGLLKKHIEPWAHVVSAPQPA